MVFNLFKNLQPIVTPSPITPQIQADLDFIKHLYDQLGIMWDNGDKRVFKASDDDVYAGYRRYEDDFIHLQVDIYIRSAMISIKGMISFVDTQGYIKSTYTRSVDICHTYVKSYDGAYTPINWTVSDECKANVLRYIDDTIFNGIAYTTLEKQFCKRLQDHYNGDM